MSDDRDLRTEAVEPGCPSPQSLASFSSGRVPEEALVTIADHVSQCDTCAETLRGLSAASDSLASRLRNAVRQSLPVEEPGSLRLQASARSIPHARIESFSTETRLELESAVLFASTPTVRPRPDADDAPATEYWSPPLPEAVGRYRVQSELGFGGFGSVYLAHDADLDRLVAIKVPKFTASVTDPMIRWFLGEARTAARLKHPGIVGIYEVGRDQDGSCFIVMEYVEGRSLSAKMAGGNLSASEGVEIIAQAAAAAHYAHKKGLVHRDLKPGNILLDADGQVKIADFGLALHENQQRSRAGERAGTLAYMSPEQLRGDTHQLDGRSDIWALGVILYEVLTGKRPFDGTKEQMADEILNRPVRPLRQIRDDIDPDLEAICLKCLAKDPQQRYSSCHDMATALTRWRQGKPQVAPRRSRPLLTALVVALALAGILAGVAIWQIRQREAPYLVDAVARPFEPLDLMDRGPEEVFPLDGPDERYLPNTRAREIWTESSGDVQLGLGTTESDMYRLSVDFRKVARSGVVSLFFGLREAPPVNGLKRWRFQAVSLQYYADGTIIAFRQRMTMNESWSGSLSLIPEPFAEARLDGVAFDSVPLDVEIRGGRVTAVRIAGQLRPQLNDPAMGLVDLPVTGRFGVLNLNGTTTFRNAQFESLKPKAPR